MVSHKKVPAMRQRFPVVVGRKADLPGKRDICPICEKSLKSSLTRVALRGGAVGPLKDGETLGPVEAARGYLDICWNREVMVAKECGYQYAHAELAHAVNGGQFSISVCSIKCLRRLLALWVAELVANVRTEKDAGKKSSK